jgi:hypothetical protein
MTAKVDGFWRHVVGRVYNGAEVPLRLSFVHPAFATRSVKIGISQRVHES